MYQLTNVNKPSNSTTHNITSKNSTNTRKSSFTELSSIELREDVLQDSKNDSSVFISEIMNSVENDIRNSQQTKTNSLIKNVPEDVLRQVFSFLDRDSLYSTMMVNKQWYQASGKSAVQNFDFCSE